MPLCSGSPAGRRVCWVGFVSLVILAGLAASTATMVAVPDSTPSPSGAGGTGHPLSLSTLPAGPVAAFTLSEVGATPAAVSLTWPVTNDAQFYNYTVNYSSAGPGGPWSVAVVLPGNRTDTSYAMTGLDPGTTYWWTVTDYGFPKTTPSNVLEVTQPTLSYLTVTQLSASTAQFSWTNNATYGGLLSFDLYQLMESAGGGSPIPASVIRTVSTLTVNVAGLIPGTSYSFYLVTTDCVATCAGGPSAQSASQSNSVTYGSPLPLIASLTESKAFVDAGQPDYFTCTPTGGQSPFEFAWNFGQGLYTNGSASESSTFSANGSAAANYTVVCRVTDALSTVSSAAIAVNVLPAPSVTLHGIPVGLDIAETGTFNCTVAGGLYPYSIVWTFGDGSSVPGGLVDHAFASSGTVGATCVAVDGTATQATASAIVSVSPALRISVGANSLAAAPGTTLLFTTIAANGSGTYTQDAWNFGDGSTTTGSSASHAYVADGNYTVTLSVTDSNGVTVSNTTLITVTSLAAVVSTDSSNVQTGTMVTFTASASGGAGAPYNYTWTFGDGTTGYGPSVTHAYGSAGTFYPALMITDRLGAAHTISSVAITVISPSTPAALISPLEILGIALIVGVVVGALELARRRRRDEALAVTLAGRVPPTDPTLAAQGSKVCRICGTANLPVRKSCEACGASLGWTIQS